MLELESTNELLHQSPLPRQFMFEGQLFNISSSSASSLAEVATGQNPIGHVTYSSLWSEKDTPTITVWFGLLDDLSFKPFTVNFTQGNIDTREAALTAYTTLKMMMNF